MYRRETLCAASVLALGAVAAGCDAPPVYRAPTLAALSPATVVASSRLPPPDEIRHGPRTGHKVAPTFLWQGEPVLVSGLLGKLARANVKVKVLDVGTWLATSPELAKRVLTDRHDRGNHAQHHEDIKQMTPARAQAETAECVRPLTALSDSIGRWMRPSQSQYATARIKAAGARVGYRSCLSYDVDSRDYTDPGPAAVVANTMKTAWLGSIIRLHFGRSGTTSAIALLIAALRGRAWYQ